MRGVTLRVHILVPLLVLLQAGCTRSENSDAPLPIKHQTARIADEGVNTLNTADATFQHTDWNTLNLPGKRLELIDPMQVEVLALHEDGHVSATIGTKEVVAAPIFFWMVKNGILLVSEDKGFSTIFSELSAPRLEAHPASDAGQTLSVTAKNGRQIRYKLSQQR